jgi:hypothetical protein
MTIIGPNLTGLRGTQITGSISYTLVTLAVNTTIVNTPTIKSDKQDVGHYPTRGPNLGKTYVSLCCLIAIEFAGSPDRTMI